MGVNFVGANLLWGKIGSYFFFILLGFSVGVGSGEFYVYRVIRRREYNRVVFIEKIVE